MTRKTTLFFVVVGVVISDLASFGASRDTVIFIGGVATGLLADWAVKEGCRE